MSNSDSQTTLRHRAQVHIEACPMAAAVDLIGDRWSLLILREAFYGVVRHADFRDDLRVPRSVLTDRLAKLVSNGLLNKLEYKEDGARRRHAYVLSPKGQALAPAFIALTEWGTEHCLNGKSPIDIVDKTTGQSLYVALVDEDGQTHPIDQIAIKVLQDG